MGTPKRAPFSHHPRPAPSILELRGIRAAHVERVDAAAAKRRTLDPIAAMPHTLLAAGCYLAAHGLTDEPCEGERFFRVDFADYAALAAGCPEVVETGRRAIYENRHAILPRLPMQVAA
jgi:hypothetical protein